MTDRRNTLALGLSRSRVLDVLQQSAAPLAINEVATAVGLHPNTVRFHLDNLVAQGFAAREREGRERPGRPRALYRATLDAQRVGQRSYRLLAEILAGYLAKRGPESASAALHAGEAWGRLLTERPATSRHVDTGEATRQLVATLDDIGFDPEAVRSGRSRHVLLHHCPFREVAEKHRDVVCSVHLGLMRGVLDELDAPLAATRLEPLVEPNLCVAELARRSSN